MGGDFMSGGIAVTRQGGNISFIAGVDYTAAATSPGVDNDGVDTAGLGHSFNVGNLWTRTDTAQQWVCVSNATGAAVWQILTQTPAWVDWTPTLTCSGSMTISAESIVVARYRVVGKSLFLRVYIGGTLAGTASNQVIASLPGGITLKDDNHATGSYAYDTSTGNMAGYCQITAAGIKFSLTSGNWLVGSTPMYASVCTVLELA
jgi:hypothetical protein